MWLSCESNWKLFQVSGWLEKLIVKIDAKELSYDNLISINILELDLLNFY